MIQHLVFDGVADGPIGVALDVITTASRLVHAGLAKASSRALRQRVVSIDGKPVKTSSGRLLVVDGALTLRGLGRDDAIVLPGLGAATDQQVTTLLAREDIARGLVSLSAAVRKNVLVAASCSSTFVLGAAGVLDGREATTTWWLQLAFARRFPQVGLQGDRMVVESRGVITAGASLAHTDLMLWLVTRLGGPRLASLIANYLVVDGRDSQSRYLVREHLRTTDPLAARLEAYILARVERQISVAELAKASATSPRTLARRLDAALATTPQRFAQRVRVQKALQLLETTKAPIDEIAARVGYADAAAFRRIFKRETGESPLSRRLVKAAKSK